MIYTYTQVIVMLNMYCQWHKVKDIAPEIPISESGLHDVLKGRLLPGPKVLRYFGLRKTEGGNYVPCVKGIA
jgi:hypothetical protein